MGLFDTVTDFTEQADLLRSRRYGMIAASGGRLVAIYLRPFPKIISLAEVTLQRSARSRRLAEDSCWLYYNQPRACSNFLALKYLVSGPKTCIATLLAALRGLEEIAQIKGTDAIVCDVSNGRISDRLLSRQGWEAHAPRRWHRNYIKRFYGTYPTLRDEAKNPNDETIPNSAMIKAG